MSESVSLVCEQNKVSPPAEAEDENARIHIQSSNLRRVIPGCFIQEPIRRKKKGIFEVFLIPHHLPVNICLSLDIY